eukprot:Seg2173.2 transcript_id=Seg2173.2/GoldUCD/mRNA.D3Y31 product="Succinate dehydrogenase assembly factor 2 mitochondrial" protein_id=Seg2173.2/GoldUCD/D3Y31
MHLRFPKKRNFWTWEELGCLSRSLGFQQDLFIKNIPKKKKQNFQEGLRTKDIAEMIDQKALSLDLHRTFNMHDSAYNTKVIEKSMEILTNRYLRFEQINDARVAFQLYEHMDHAGLAINEHTITRTLKMCGFAVSSLKLMQHIRHMDRLVPDRLMFYEFLDVLLICEKLPGWKRKSFEVTMEAKTEKDDRNLFELHDFRDMLLTEDEKLSERLNDSYKKSVEKIPVRKSSAGKEKANEKRWLVPPIVDHRAREKLTKINNGQRKLLNGQLLMSNTEVLVDSTSPSCDCGKPDTALLQEAKGKQSQRHAPGTPSEMQEMHSQRTNNTNLQESLNFHRDLVVTPKGERMRRKREQTGVKRRIYRRIPANADDNEDKDKKFEDSRSKPSIFIYAERRYCMKTEVKRQDSLQQSKYTKERRSMFKFGKKKANEMSQQATKPTGAGKNDKEIMYTTILASSTQKKLALNIMNSLERMGRVIINNKSQVVNSGGSDQLIQYMLRLDVPGVVVLSSKELADFLDGKGGQLQITGQDVALDSNVIAEKFKSDRKVKAKILVVVPNGKSNDCPPYMEGIQAARYLLSRSRLFLALSRIKSPRTNTDDKHLVECVTLHQKYVSKKSFSWSATKTMQDSTKSGFLKEKERTPKSRSERKSMLKRRSLFGITKAKEMSRQVQRSHSIGAGTNAKDMKYTTILASSTQKMLAMNIMSSLEKMGRVIINSKSQVVNNGSSENLIQYMQRPGIAGVVVLSSKELADFLGGKGGQLQITGQNVAVDPSVIAEKFKSDGTVRAKILVVVPNGKSNDCPPYMEGIQVLQLTDDKGSYGMDIVNNATKKDSSGDILDFPDMGPPIPEYQARKDEPLDRRRARLFYQSRKRGMSENGLLLSTFASLHLHTFDEKRLGLYDTLINQPSNDWEIFYWMTEKKLTPPEYDNEIMDMLKKHARNENLEMRCTQPDLDEKTTPVANE